MARADVCTGAGILPAKPTLRCTSAKSVTTTRTTSGTSTPFSIFKPARGHPLTTNGTYKGYGTKTRPGGVIAQKNRRRIKDGGEVLIGDAWFLVAPKAWWIWRSEWP
jgi:hypothetical protein